MPTLRPFRNYDEKDVINVFAFSGTIPTYKGTFVTINRGFVATDEPLEMLGDVGASYTNVVSERYGAYARVTTAGATDTILGMMLMDVRETDENGEALKFNPVKCAEMGVVLSGQAVPIVTRGDFHYSGAILAAQTPVAKSKLYVLSGELSTGYSLGAITGDTPYWASGTPSGVSGTAGVSGIASQCVGYCLGGKDDNSCVMVHLDI